MSSTRRGTNYLVTVLRNREWIILKKYIPPTLFIETNLPSIRVLDPQSGMYIPEDAPLALSIYLPGKPLYRIGRPRGVLIPIKRKHREHEFATSIDEYYRMDFIRRIRLNMKLPEEYRYYVDKILGLISVGIYIIDEIRPEPYLSRQRCYQWFSWFDGSMYSFLQEPRSAEYYRSIIERNIRNAINNNKNGYPIRVVTKRSNSYGRSIFWYLSDTSLTEMGYGKYEEIFKELLEKFGIRSVGFYHIENMYRLLYAIDFRLVNKRYLLTNSNIVRDLNEICRSQQSNIIQISNSIVEGTKILGKEVNSGIEPTMIGYKINDTRLVKMDFERRFIINFANHILGEIADLDIPKYEDLGKLSSFKSIYTILSVNQTLIDLLRFFLANDLSITIKAAEKRLKLEPLVDLAITYVDLYSDNKFSDIINSTNCEEVVLEISKKIVTYVENIIEREPDQRALIVKYFLYGKRTVVPSRINLDELKNETMRFVTERIRAILCDRNRWPYCSDWRCNALWATLLHTFNHHVILLLSKRSNIPVSYLSEVYDFNQKDSSVFETVSGSIGAIDTTINYWVEHTYEAFEELVLRFGSCLLGFPEDLIYFAIASIPEKELKKFSPQEVVDYAIDKLSVIYTPEERREAIKLYNALQSEAARLVSLVKQQPSRDDVLSLLKEVIRARYECEKEFKRFCSTDEIILCIFKSLPRYQLIRNLLKTIIAKLLEAKPDKFERLAYIYGISKNDDLAEMVLNDIHRAVAGIRPRLDLRDNQDIVIDFARALKATFIKLYLKSCDSACGLCYLNTHSCRFGAPWIQKKILNRRLAKLYATYAIRDLAKNRGDNIAKLLGKIRLAGDTKYLVLD